MVISPNGVPVAAQRLVHKLGVPLKPRNPYLILRVSLAEKVPIFRVFFGKSDPLELHILVCLNMWVTPSPSLWLSQVATIKIRYDIST